MQQEIQRLRRRLLELAGWRNREIVPLSGSFQAADMAEPVPIEPGQDWASRAFPVRMSLQAVVPEGWAGQPVLLHLSVGGEGLLSCGGRPLGGLNPYHREHLLLARAQGGEHLALEVEAVPRGLFGAPVARPRLEEAFLLLPDLDVRALLTDLAMALEAAAQVGEELGTLLLDAIARACAELRLPRSLVEGYLARLVQTPVGAAMAGELWEEWQLAAAPLALPEKAREQLLQARRRFHERLGRLRRRYPPVGALLLSGHAHLDLAWLWPKAETRRKARRTFATVLSLMERYPELTFNQSTAQLYAWVEEDDPELFARIRARVRQGRWEPIGGMWVEADGNLLSGESWARQLLYGQRYFASRFGRRPRVAWLPDTFGYAGNLPQLFRAAGMGFFFTTKMTWNDTNPFPYDLYWWEGLDGSRVLAHSIRNTPRGYNGRIEPADLKGTWQNFQGKRHHPVSLFPFGEGDGGGGPTAEMVEQFRRLQEFPGLPRLEMGRVEDFYSAIEGKDLPTWVGEQYLELHRGTYTTQAYTKALNRRLEHVLPEAEAAATLVHLQGELYPKEDLESGWKALLRNQFHDILPGSGIHTAAEEANQEMAEALEQAEMLRLVALTDLSQGVAGHPNALTRIIVWNLSLDDRPLRLAFARPAEGPFRLLTPEGEEVLYQEEGDQVLAAGNAPVPGLGYVTLSAVPGQPKAGAGVRAKGRVLENRYLLARVGPEGTLQHLYDKGNGRQVLAGRGNQIWAYTDIPRDWEAWDVDASYLQEGQELVAEGRPEIVAAGPVRAGVRVVRRIGNSTIEQVYWLWAGSRRLEIETRVLWEERATLLRALFPLGVRSHEAWFETAFGAVPRPTHRNTSWDQARFEVPALRFADLSEPGYGVSLLNDGKYGHNALGNVLGLSLLRGPVYPDPFADRGEHRFTYALYPHAGDWRQGTIAQAHDLNAPLRATLLPGCGGGRPAQKRLLEVDTPALRLSALKRAEDGEGIVLRLYEAHGGRGMASLKVEGLGAAKAWQVNLLEEAEEEWRLQEGRLRFPFGPYQVLSFRLGR